MKRKYIIQLTVLLLLALGQQTFAQISFNQKDNWAVIVNKAKASGKHIMVDAYATWCEPCKRMDADVYPDKNAGAYYNANFISVKVQLDQTKADGAREKAWYAKAKQMAEDYQVKAMPTILFFSPDGKLVGRSIGYKNPEQLIEAARDIIEPGKKETDSLAAVYYADLLAPFLRTYPSWNEVEERITGQRGNAQLLTAVVKRYSNGVAGNGSADILIGALKSLEGKYPKTVTSPMLNSAAFALSAMTTDRDELKLAASWSERTKYENFSYLDTYASILYKMGEKAAAVKLETKAVEISNGHPAMAAMLEKMKNGGPLFKEFGESVRGLINLTGSWALDTAGSDFGEIPAVGAAPMSINIRQDGSTASFERVMNGAKSEESLRLDGSPLVQQLIGAVVTRTLTRSSDGSVITMFSDFAVTPKDGTPYRFNREEIYTLMDGGKSLLLTRITTTADKIDVVKALYGK